jgi:PiT family inorganic phosphate transporter
VTWLFLLSGVFLGWSLGANDGANIFGTAVGTKMVRFRTAAWVAAFFVVVGAVAGAHGTAQTLGRLGSIDAPAGAFVVALAAGLAVVVFLSRNSLPVSISQSIVGAIVGWNLFTGRPTDLLTLTTLLSSWFVSPALSGTVAALLFVCARAAIPRLKIHLLEVDAWMRATLIAVGAFAAFSLGQNAIANVMGVFVRVSPFPDAVSLGPFRATSVQMLFFLGGLAIAAGILTYSERIMVRLGAGLTSLSPLAALIVVFAASMSLFLFGSPTLQALLKEHSLPGWPLVPVSGSQAIVGAILGISLVRRSGIRHRVLVNIAIGWIAAPLAALLLAFVGLFVFQNVFQLPVSSKSPARPNVAASASGPAAPAGPNDANPISSGR